MKTIWKKYRVLLAAGAMAVCMTAGLGLGIHWSRIHTEKMVVEAAGDELAHEAKEAETDGIWEGVQREPWEAQSEPWDSKGEAQDARLYKDVVMDAEIAKEVCKKYNLDYDTVHAGDVTREMRNYEEALWLLKEMGDCPLIGTGFTIKGGGMSSLQGYICEIYAFSGGEEVIRDKCAEFGINPDQAVVSDLTEEQLIQIGEEAFETSDHPKE